MKFRISVFEHNICNYSVKLIFKSVILSINDLWTRNDIVVPMMAVWSKRKTCHNWRLSKNFESIFRVGIMTIEVWESWLRECTRDCTHDEKPFKTFFDLSNQALDYQLSTIISFIWVLLLKTTKMIFYFIFMLKTISHFSQTRKSAVEL